MFRRFVFVWFLMSAWFGIAADIPTDPNMVVLVADLHIGNDVPEHAARLSQFCEEVAAMNPRPEAVIVLGDMVSTVGTTEEYQAIRPLFAPLDAAKIPWYLVVGNHDNRKNMWAAFPEKKSEVPEFPGRQTQVVDLPSACFLLFDTRMDDSKEYMSHREEFPERRPWDGKRAEEKEKNWIRATFAKCQKPAFLCVHHPLKETGLEDTLEGSSYLRGYIFGHTHANSCTCKKGVVVVEVPTTSTRVLKPTESAGYVVLHILDDGVKTELKSLPRK